MMLKTNCLRLAKVDLGEVKNERPYGFVGLGVAERVVMVPWDSDMLK